MAIRPAYWTNPALTGATAFAAGRQDRREKTLQYALQREQLAQRERLAQQGMLADIYSQQMSQQNALQRMGLAYQADLAQQQRAVEARQRQQAMDQFYQQVQAEQEFERRKELLDYQHDFLPGRQRAADAAQKVAESVQAKRAELEQSLGGIDPETLNPNAQALYRGIATELGQIDDKARNGLLRPQDQSIALANLMGRATALGLPHHKAQKPRTIQEMIDEGQILIQDGAILHPKDVAVHTLPKEQTGEGAKAEQQSQLVEVGGIVYGGDGKVRFNPYEKMLPEIEKEIQDIMAVDPESLLIPPDGDATKGFLRRAAVPAPAPGGAAAPGAASAEYVIDWDARKQFIAARARERVEIAKMISSEMAGLQGSAAPGQAAPGAGAMPPAGQTVQPQPAGPPSEPAAGPATPIDPGFAAMDPTGQPAFDPNDQERMTPFHMHNSGSQLPGQAEMGMVKPERLPEVAIQQVQGKPTFADAIAMQGHPNLYRPRPAPPSTDVELKSQVNMAYQIMQYYSQMQKQPPRTVATLLRALQASINTYGNEQAAEQYRQETARIAAELSQLLSQGAASQSGVPAKVRTVGSF